MWSFPSALRVCSTAVALLGLFGQGARAQMVDSVNGSAAPDYSLTWTVANDVGWYYTPAVSYELTNVQTKFESGDARLVDVEVHATSGTDIGTLLGSGSFTPVGNVFSGADVGHISILAGTQYFIGFRNVNGLTVNVTADDGATNLGILRYSSDGSFSSSFAGAGNPNGQPILLFESNASTPEPGSIALVSCLVSAGMLLARRQRRSDFVCP